VLAGQSGERSLGANLCYDRAAPGGHRQYWKLHTSDDLGTMYSDANNGGRDGVYGNCGPVMGNEHLDGLGSSQGPKACEDNERRARDYPAGERPPG
jgi:hypothetical protein